MAQFIIFLIIGIVGIIIGYYFAVGRKVRKHRDLANASVGGGNDSLISEQADKMSKNLEKARGFVQSRESVTNDDLQKFLDVSDSTATRYLDALEREGVVKQVGDTGSGVRYERVN